MTSSLELQATETAGELIRVASEQLDSAGLFYGHGTGNALDEAAALVFHVLSLDHNGGAELYASIATPEQRQVIVELLERRIKERIPLPYLLHEAWFGGLTFYVDERVLIPRSPIAELIADQFEPWVTAATVRNILEIGTGSGCIAIACARAFPAAQVTATDISVDALAVAELNQQRYGLAERLSLVETDHADAVNGQFDIIVTNPPYVPDGEMAELPAEYAHEPALGLVSGSDGLDSARRILQDATRLLAPGGILVLEVGAQWQDLEQAFPALPLTWLDFEYGGEGVALLYQQDLSDASL